MTTAERGPTTQMGAVFEPLAVSLNRPVNVVLAASLMTVPGPAFASAEVSCAEVVTVTVAAGGVVNSLSSRPWSWPAQV